MKTSQKQTLVWLGGIVLTITLIALGSWVYISRIPPLAEQFRQNSVNTSVYIISPADQSTYPADASIPIRITTATEIPVSSFELWVNGRLVLDQPAEESEKQYYTHSFFWTPTTENSARILVRALTKTGEAITSNLVRINISDPAGLRIVSRENPDDPDAQTRYPLGSTRESDLINPGSSPGSNPVLQPGKPINNDPLLWLGQRFRSQEVLPSAPGLSYFLDNCSVKLLITDSADNELGYFVYRSRKGSPSFERITGLEAVEQGTTFSYTDPELSNETIYYVAAFNGAGESASSPVMINEPDSRCQSLKVSSSPADLTEEELEILELAYFYYSFNNSGYHRYPSDPGSFLTPSEYPTSLKALVETLFPSFPFPVSSADLVVWGWSGGALVNLGAYHLELDDSRLTVCNLGTACDGDVASGFRSTYGELAIDEDQQIRAFYWSTNAPGTTDILWQISIAPFSKEFSPHPYGLVGAGCSEGSLMGSFQLDFQALDDYLPAPSSCGGYSQPWVEYSKFAPEMTQKPASEIRYFIRFTPMAGNQPAGKPSNPVEILAKPGESFIEPVIVDHLPEIYQVEIVDFVPIKDMDPKYWGCVEITGLDYDVIWNYFRSRSPLAPDDHISQLTTKLYNDLNYAIENNLLVCPAPYNKSSDSGSVFSDWGSMFIEGVTALWDSVVSAFNSLKEGIVDVAAAAINKLGIPCDAKCKAGLKTGLEIGIAYFTGIPPSLPSFEQLADQGIEYMIELAAAEAGIPCPEECQEILREGIKSVVNTIADSSSQPGCVDENWANVLGKHSLCLPPGVETEAVKEGIAEPARAYIKITRKGEELPGQYQYNNQPAYTVNIRVTAENTKLSGTTIPYDYSYWKGNSGYKKRFTVYAPIIKLQNDVFDSQSLPIPPLSPGEEVIIPFALTYHSYFIPEHLHSLMIELNSRNLEVSDVGGVGGNRAEIFDWVCLYRGAMIKIEADVSCLSVPAGVIGTTSPDENSQLVPCGATALPVLYQETSNTCYP